MGGLIPPIAVPLSAAEILRSATDRTHPAAGFLEQLKSTAGVPHARLFASAREGLCEVLLAAARTHGGQQGEVLVPAYTCWTVPSAVVRAGLRVRVADVDPVTLDYVPSSLEAALETAAPGRLVAVVAAHLFARTADIVRTAASARAAAPGALVIEDAAQAWPSAEAGTADALLLSFGRGKPLPLGHGGAVLSRSPLLPEGSAPRNGGHVGLLRIAATARLGRPPFFGPLSRLPFLGIGTTVFDPDFATGGPFYGWQARLGLDQVRRLSEFEAQRARNAARLAERIARLQGWALTAAANRPGPLRLAVLAPSRAVRDAALERLLARGVAASAMYPGTLLDIDRLRPDLANPDADISGARALADRLVTLPVYPGLSESMLERIERAIGYLAG